MVTRLQEFEMPFGAAVLDDGTTVLSETPFHRLRCINEAGGEAGTFGSKGSNPGCFEGPRGMCVVDPFGLVAVADTGNARVQVIRASTGKAVRTVSRGRLKRPWDVACSPDGEKLFVADMGLNCVVVFDGSGDVLKTFDAALFDKPCRIEFHSHTRLVHIADRGGARVHALSLDLEYKGAHDVASTAARPI